MSIGAMPDHTSYNTKKPLLVKLFPEMLNIHHLSFFSFPRVVAILALRLTPNQGGDFLTDQPNHPNMKHRKLTHAVVIVTI